MLTPIDVRQLAQQNHVQMGAFSLKNSRYRRHEDFNPGIAFGQARNSFYGHAEAGAGPDSGDVDSEEWEAAQQRHSATHGHASQGARTVDGRYVSHNGQSNDGTVGLASPTYAESKRRSVHATAAVSKQQL